VPLTFDGEGWAPYAQLAGLALPVLIETSPVDATPKQRKKAVVFSEDLLFTHRGLSGPAVLQISSFWREGQPIRINLAPGVDLPALLLRAKATSKKLIANELATLVPSRLADAWVSQDPALQRPISEATDKALLALGPAPGQLGTHPQRLRRLQKSRSHHRRRRHPRFVLPDPRIKAARPLFHRRSRRRHRLAGRLQLPVGLGQRPCLCPGIGGQSGSLSQEKTPRQLENRKILPREAKAPSSSLPA
jgi:hypothetical protein